MVTQLQISISFLRKVTLLTFLFTTFSLSISAQHFSEAKIKTAYIVQFIQNILWPNENEIDTFKISIISTNEMYIDEFVELSKMKSLKNRPISLSIYNSIESIKEPFPQVVFVDSDYNEHLETLLSTVGSNSTLIITDNAQNKELVMINFTYSDTQRRRISFELNSLSIEEDHNLSVLPRLLLLGGSKIDVAELYLKQEQVLVTEREMVERLRHEIDSQENTITKQRLDIERQKHEIEEQQYKLTQQEKYLDSLQLATLKQQSVLNSNIELLKKYQDDINFQKEQLEFQNAEFDKRNRVLEVQNIEIKNQQERIDAQKSILNEQTRKLGTQTNLLYISYAAVFLALGMLFFMFLSYSNKKKANKLLNENNLAIELKNNEIFQKNEELKSQAELLEETNKELEKLSIVASKTNNSVIIMEPTGEIEWINPVFTKLSGINIEDFVKGQKISLFDVSTYEFVREVFSKCIETKESVNYESSYDTASKDSIWLQTTLTPICNANGDVTKVVAIDSDITQIKNAHQETIGMLDEIVSQAELIQKQNDEITAQKDNLEKAHNQLIKAEKMASLGVLTAGIAHEINNPINFVYAGVNSIMRDFVDVDQVLSIILNIESLNENPEDTIRKITELKDKYDFKGAYNAIRETINDIMVGAQRTAEIVQGLRNFSRSEKEEFSFTNINKIVEGVLVLLKNKYKHNIEIIKNLDSSLPEIECKMGKMNQVLMNLISNAIDAIENKGTITITTKHAENSCIITVVDDGGGIPLDVLPKIFDPFYTTKDVGKGTGLGLSISYGIIEEHNGTIEVKSEPGKGTEFNITIPLKQH
ncbi:MAG TPA: YfiR/HmsC family protein [Tenuifilaceae bacterium]|nr:YfiR/HmsC family protein [Tenuifilaceae bacterium]HPE18031.1 YfiR/HmsC family protein [Tenuifilaceae bacterium]HRX68514.1 YfiR/HmsC family protein [Tenuifilaceae bacterium]